MLLYHIPDQLRNQVVFSSVALLPLAEAMIDYTLFEPRVWREVHVHGTIAEFLSTAMYQVVRRLQVDPTLCDGSFPSFEMGWRQSLSTRLRTILTVPPDALCSSIHRVIPIGVSSSDAMQALEVAIPKDIQDPYAITVQSSAIDDQCGSIAITQPMNHTIINVSCSINPRILVEVCRELRTGHRAVVNEVHEIRQEMTKQNHETNQKLSIMTSLVSQLMKKQNVDTPADNGDFVTCTKHGCINVVKECFSSGKRRRQCVGCLLHASKTKKQKIH
jgi:hypothetical protein